VRIRVSDHGQSLPWRLGPSQEVERWLQQEPWRTSGGIRSVGVLRVDPKLNSAVLKALEMEARRACQNTDVPSFRNITIECFGEPLLEQLMTELQPEARTTSGVVQALKDTCTDVRPQFGGSRHHTPLMLLVDRADTNESPSSLGLSKDKADLEELADIAGQQGLRLCAAMVSSKTSHDTWDYSMALPSPETLGSLPDIDALDELWPWYRAVRLAWLAGGDWQRFDSWRSEIAGVAMGDDSQLLRKMARLAKRARHELDDSTIDMVNKLHPLARTVVAASDPEAEKTYRSVLSHLEGAGLLWRPPEHTTKQLVPWLALALLQEHKDRPDRGWLRNSVVCTPIIQDLLKRVFEFEWSSRAGFHLLAPQVLQEMKDEDIHLWLDGTHESARYYDESDRILLPTAPSESVTFGSFLYELREKVPSSGQLNAIKDLRNALAHGHPVGWGGYKSLWDLTVKLDNSHSMLEWRSVIVTRSKKRR